MDPIMLYDRLLSIRDMPPKLDMASWFLMCNMESLK